MYYEPSDTPMLSRTSNLNEELGQVSPYATPSTDPAYAATVLSRSLLRDIAYGPTPRTDIRCGTNVWYGPTPQVQYLFSDKTGTLTRNEMEFRKVLLVAKYRSTYAHPE